MVHFPLQLTHPLRLLPHRHRPGFVLLGGQVQLPTQIRPQRRRQWENVIIKLEITRRHVIPPPSWSSAIQLRNAQWNRLLINDFNIIRHYLPLITGLRNHMESKRIEVHVTREAVRCCEILIQRALHNPTPCLQMGLQGWDKIVQKERQPILQRGICQASPVRNRKRQLQKGQSETVKDKYNERREKLRDITNHQPCITL